MSLSPKSISKKTVLITGAGKGIGKAISEKFLSEGYIVYGTYFSSKENISELENKYGKDKFINCGSYDFRNLDDTDNFVKSLMGIKLDTLICNAGIFSENDDFLNFDLNEFNKTMNCNFYTPLILGIKLQHNIKDNGSIVIISSNDAFSGAFTSMSYSISKSALLSLTKCLCVNYGRRNIRVNSVAPGAINTNMNTPEQLIESPNFTPIKRVGQPQEVAETVFFLASSESSFINGENIILDGGYGNISVLLQKEADRFREYKDYNYVYDQYKKMSKGNTLIDISQGDFYTWIDSENEKELLKQSVLADRRGAIINRIIIVSKEKLEKFKKSILTKQYIENVQPHSKLFIVHEEDVIKYCPDSYQKVGMGFGVFDSKFAFIDSPSSIDDGIVYIVEGENLISPLINSFSNIYKNIKNGKIKQITMKK